MEVKTYAVQRLAMGAVERERTGIARESALFTAEQWMLADDGCAESDAVSEIARMGNELDARRSTSYGFVVGDAAIVIEQERRRATLTEVKAAAWDRLMESTRAKTDDALLEAWQWYQRASERTHPE